MVLLRLFMLWEILLFICLILCYICCLMIKVVKVSGFEKEIGVVWILLSVLERLFIFKVSVCCILFWCVILLIMLIWWVYVLWFLFWCLWWCGICSYCWRCGVLFFGILLRVFTYGFCFEVRCFVWNLMWM